MQEMIKRILEMDEQARQLTEDASALKVQAEMTVGERRKALKEEYLTRARQKIAQLEKTEREFAQADLQKTIQHYDSLMNQLDRTCESNFENWINQITARTIEGS